MAVKSYAWTTVDRLSTFIGVSASSGSTNETLLEYIINSLTEYCENYVDRRIKQTTYTNEVYSGDGSDSILLKNYPVDSGSAFTLQIRASLSNEDTWESIDSDQYYVNYDTGIVEFISGRRFMKGSRNYRVTYTAGYDFDNSSTFLTDTEAGDLEYAIWKMGAGVFERRKSGGGIKREQIGDYSVEYATELFENDEVKAILDKYRRGLQVYTYHTPDHS